MLNNSQMQVNSFLKRIFYIPFLTLLIAVALNSTLAQTSSQPTPNKEDEKETQASLQGLTEAILIDGQPVLKIIIGKNGLGYTEVRYEKRDGEDALVFYVAKMPFVWGKFYVTKKNVAFVPDSEAKKYFKVEKENIEKLELKNNWRLCKSCIHVNIDYENDEKAIGIAYVDAVVSKIPFNGIPKFNKENYFSANAFLYLAIKDFDSALAEFNKLTASVRQIDEEEEEEFTDEEIETNEKYDRFKDRTFVSTSKMRIKGKKRSIRTYAEYDFAGKTQTKPENITLYFYGSATSPIFREDNLELNFLVDGKRVSLGKMDFVEEEKRKTIIRQTVSVSIPYETFNQIVNGKKVEFQVGNLDYMLTDEHLEAFRKFLHTKLRNKLCKINTNSQHLSLL